MKLNENVTVVGNNVIFIPYTKYHVEKYHGWMKSPELLEQTASEPLSLEEEYCMQEKWWTDDNKCTFIILSRNMFEQDCTDKEVSAMIGDVNLFFNNPDDNYEAELELMIAELSSRGKGYGKESAKLMMYFGVKFLNVKKYVVKIGVANLASISLFTKLGFKLESHSNVFKESTFGLFCDSKDFLNGIYKEVDSYFRTTEYQSLK